MTHREKVIVSAYTGILMCDFSDVHEYIEKILGGAVWTHQLADKKIWDDIKAASKSDFIAICEAEDPSKGDQFGISEQFPKWIPVTEWLPPAKKEVYVTDGEYIARANLLDEVFPGDKPCWSYSGLGEITHWCEQIPLPKQPKKE